MVSYVPPHQRGYQNNNQNPQSQQQGNQPPHGNFHQGQGSSSSQPAGMNAGRWPRHVDDVVGILLNTQQHIQGNIQANNDLVHKMQDAQQEQKTAMDMLTKQLSQMATTLNEIRGHDGRLHATVKMPDKANISKITLRSGRDYDEPLGRTEKEDGEESRGNISLKDSRDTPPQVVEPQALDPEPEDIVEEVRKHGREDSREGTSNVVKRMKPYPYRGDAKRQKEDLTDFMEIFGKLEINLPFLQALKLPPFSRFIKDFIAGKAKADGKIVIGESVSAVLQKRMLPSKRNDPGMFTLPIVIGDVKI